MYFQKKPNQLKTKVFTSNIDSIPWEECSKIYKEAADLAESNILEAAKAIYDKAYDNRKSNALALAGIDESEASYEGDLNIEYSLPELDPLKKRLIRNKAGNDALAEYFIKPYSIKSFGVTLLEQIIALYGKHKINNLGSEGTISGIQYLKDNVDPKSERDMGIYRFLMLDARSTYLDKMGSGDAKKYCSLVPLIMYAQKLYNNVPYNQWERETLNYVVNESLCQAMLTDIPILGRERLLQLRDIGLIQKGEKRNPSSTYSLYRLGDTELADCNSLVKIMLCQTWAAHPTNRTKYMVLDPLNWDNMPTPLVDINIFKNDDNTGMNLSNLSNLGSRKKILETSDPWI